MGLGGVSSVSFLRPTKEVEVELGCDNISPKIWMNNNVINFISLRIQWLLLPILSVILPQVDGDLAELGPVNTMRSRGYIPMVEQDPPTLVRTYSDVNLPRQLRKLGLLTPNNSFRELSVS